MNISEGTSLKRSDQRQRYLDETDSLCKEVESLGGLCRQIQKIVSGHWAIFHRLCSEMHELSDLRNGELKRSRLSRLLSLIRIEEAALRSIPDTETYKNLVEQKQILIWDALFHFSFPPRQLDEATVQAEKAKYWNIYRSSLLGFVAPSDAQWATCFLSRKFRFLRWEVEREMKK